MTIKSEGQQTLSSCHFGFPHCHSGLGPESLVGSSRVLQLTEEILKQVQDDNLDIHDDKLDIQDDKLKVQNDKLDL